MVEQLHTAAEVKGLCRKYQVVPSKGLGQHFLVEPHVADQILGALALKARETVVEIGAGFGALTQALVERGVTVIAVERDRRLGRALHDRFGDRPDLRIVVEDVLRTDWRAFGAGPFVVAGNLPYVITSPVLDLLVRHRPVIARAALTIQREVAQRIAADFGTKAFGALTCFVQAFFVPRLVVDVSPKAFWPQPEVTSAIVMLTPRKPPLVAPEALEPFTAVIQALFQRRRKTIVNGLLNPALCLTRPRALELLEQVGINPQVRPEMVPVESLAALARAAACARLRFADDAGPSGA